MEQFTTQRDHLQSWDGAQVCLTSTHSLNYLFVYSKLPGECSNWTSLLEGVL